MKPSAPFGLQGKTALVTGSSRGIGRAIATTFGRAGARVILHGTVESAAMEEVLRLFQDEGLDGSAVYGDIGQMEDVCRIAGATSDAGILVLNASVQSYALPGAFDPAEFTRIFNTNLRSSFLLARELAPRMAARGWGRIISIGSVNQTSPGPRLCVYASSKAAQHNLVLALAREYACHGVTANTVSPGIIATDRNAEALADSDHAAHLLRLVPARRFGTAGDCAGIVLALASDACSYITGADIPVDGGMLL